MPSFPPVRGQKVSEYDRYDSKGTPTTQKPFADAPLDRTGEVMGKMGAALGEQVQDLSMKWIQASDAIQKTTAQVNFKAGMLDIQQRAENDPDPNNSAIYQQEIEDLRSRSLKGFTSKQAETEMALDLGLESDTGKIQINKIFKNKFIDFGRAKSREGLDQIVADPRPENQKAINEYVDEKVNSLMFSAEEGYKLKKEYNDLNKTGMFLSELNRDPSAAEKGLSSNKYGFTISELESAGKVYERELKNIQDNTSKEFMQMKLNKTLKEEHIRLAIKQKRLDAKEGIAMIKDLNTVVQPQAIALDKTAAFNKLVAMRDALKDKDPWFWTNSTFEERTKYRAEVFDAHRKGLISDDEMDKDFLSEEISNKFMNDKVFQNAMKQVNSLSGQYQSKEDKEIAKAMMSKDLTRKVMEGMTPDKALQVVSAERIQADFPDVKAEDLLFTAKKYGKPVWEVYKLTRKQ